MTAYPECIHFDVYRAFGRLIPNGEFYSCPGLGAHHGWVVCFRPDVVRSKGVLGVRVEAVFCHESSSVVQDGEPQLYFELARQFC